MTSRHNSLLNELIEHYIATGQPISSGYLAAVHQPSVSPATVRNELARLEEEGYLVQPHTSAGRIPTEKAYKAYIEELGPRPLSAKKTQECASYIEELDRQHIKSLAQHLADNTGEMMYVAFGNRDTYVTGLANLVSKPEFAEQDILADISRFIDDLDVILEEVLQSQSDGVSIYIGTESGFGSACSTLVMRYTLDNTAYVLGILGPTRMNYAFNKALLEGVYTIINT
ncbi:MAG: hypothetical protein AAB870_02975 [Patescibacteria group bacterium]